MQYISMYFYLGGERKKYHLVDDAKTECHRHIVCHKGVSYMMCVYVDYVCVLFRLCVDIVRSIVFVDEALN